ncbi:WHG domain-containing protein [Streptomyces sp. NBC_00988]|nr:WHG domain-containing protein [Streptomyces sp. NBC_00988]
MRGLPPRSSFRRAGSRHDRNYAASVPGWSADRGPWPPLHGPCEQFTGNYLCRTPRSRLIAGCRAYMAFGVDNPNLYGLLFQRNRLLRGAEPRTTPADKPNKPDNRNPDAGPFAYLMDGVRLCIADGSSGVRNVLSTATQLWAAMHGYVLLRNGYEFPWPDLAQSEVELISSIARLREPDWLCRDSQFACGGVGPI